MAGHYLTVGMQYAPTDGLRRAGKLAYATLACARCGEAIAEHVNEFGDRTKGYGLEYDGSGHVCAVMCDACTRRVVDIYGWDFAGHGAMPAGDARPSLRSDRDCTA